MSIKSPFHLDHQIFLIVAEKKNISKAAESMGVGQSGVSKAVRRLEDEHGGPLFARRNQGVELTREGHALHRALINSQQAWTSSYADKQSQEDIAGSYTIGGHASVLSVYLPAGLNKIFHKYPRIDFEIVLGTSLETTRKVASLKLDFGIVVNYVKAKALVVYKLGTDSICVWRRKNSKPKWLCYNPAMLDIAQHLRSMGHTRLIPIPDYQTIYGMILSGESEGILPDSLIHDPSILIEKTKLRDVQVSLISHMDNARLPSFKAISVALK